MAKVKAPKKVIARFNGKGFKFEDKSRISHKSTVCYLDKEAFLRDREDDFCEEFLQPINLGHLLKHPRIKPGSLRTTFHILDK